MKALKKYRSNHSDALETAAVNILQNSWKHLVRSTIFFMVDSPLETLHLTLSVTPATIFKVTPTTLTISYIIFDTAIQNNHLLVYLLLKSWKSFLSQPSPRFSFNTWLHCLQQWVIHWQVCQVIVVWADTHEDILLHSFLCLLWG